jgi:hypothetical protein
MMRVLSRRVGIGSSSGAGKRVASVEYRPQYPLDRLREIGAPPGRIALVGKIAACREFHLHRVDAVRRSAVGAGDPAAFEAAIHHM